jgi:hypothetical protein
LGISDLPDLLLELETARHSGGLALWKEWISEGAPPPAKFKQTVCHTGQRAQYFQTFDRSRCKLASHARGA